MVGLSIGGSWLEFVVCIEGRLDGWTDGLREVSLSTGSPLLDGADCFRNLLESVPNPSSSVLKLRGGIDAEGDSGLLPDLKD